MYETYVTIQGWVGGDVELRDAGGVPVAHFRVACTPRRFDRRTDAWVDDPTQWYSVSAWRTLGQNCAASVRRGDPVVVYGRQRTNVWTNHSAGIEVTSLEIDAIVVGHDLNRGTAEFARTPKPDGARADAPAGTPGLPGPEAEERHGQEGVDTAAA